MLMFMAQESMQHLSYRLLGAVAARGTASRGGMMCHSPKRQIGPKKMNILKAKKLLPETPKN
jgi:hypothetical protein